MSKSAAEARFLFELAAGLWVRAETVALAMLEFDCISSRWIRNGRRGLGGMVRRPKQLHVNPLPQCDTVEPKD